MKVQRYILPVLLAGLLTGLAGPATAQPPRERGEDARQTGSDPGLDRAVAEIERRTGGRVLSAERVSRDGREVYRIKLLTPDGHVRVIRRDAGGR